MGEGGVEDVRNPTMSSLAASAASLCLVLLVILRLTAWSTGALSAAPSVCIGGVSSSYCSRSLLGPGSLPASAVCFWVVPVLALLAKGCHRDAGACFECTRLCVSVHSVGVVSVSRGASPSPVPSASLSTFVACVCVAGPLCLVGSAR